MCVDAPSLIYSPWRLAGRDYLLFENPKEDYEEKNFYTLTFPMPFFDCFFVGFFYKPAYNLLIFFIVIKISSLLLSSWSMSALIGVALGPFSRSASSLAFYAILL